LKDVDVFADESPVIRRICDHNVASSFASQFAELGVVLRNKHWHEGIGGLVSRDALDTQLLYQTVLERLVRMFNATLGRRRISADAIDIEFV
jgi:hypothetical protein